jgi:hypothetical protein
MHKEKSSVFTLKRGLDDISRFEAKDGGCHTRLDNFLYQSYRLFVHLWRNIFA